MSKSKDTCITKEVSRSPKESERIAKEFAGVLKKGDVVLLCGRLGAGKTVFVKGILKGLGIKRDIARSPSFTLIREYHKGLLHIFHIDLYRIEKIRELNMLGYEEYFYEPEGITLIEWADKVQEMIPRYIKITIDYIDDKSRTIMVDFKKNIKKKKRL